MQPHRLRPLRSSVIRGSIALATTGVVLFAALPASVANEQPGFPSQAEVEQAQERVRTTKRSADAIRADLAGASVRLEDLAAEAAKAFDAYYEATQRVSRANRAADEAQQTADKYTSRLDRQQRRIASLVADTYQDGGSFGQVSAYLMSSDSERLLNRVTAYKGASDSMASRFDSFAAHQALAEVYSDEADEALQAAKDAVAEAERIRAEAQSAVTAQQAAVASIRERRDELLRELAAAENISVQLATARQEALERIAAERRARERRERAEAEARRQAALAAQREAEREARAAERRAELAAQREARQNAQQADRLARRQADAAAERAERRLTAALAERREERAERRAQRRAERREAAPPPPEPAPAPPSSNVVLPIPMTAYFYSQDNFGNCGSLWSNCHTGNDFSAGCGTPVLAANAGTVNIRQDQSWSGPWLVEVIGHDGVVTWYAHMQAVHVYDGQSVAAGQQIGSVGTMGNSTGCHLHFEVRPGGGYSIDPLGWFSQHGIYV